MENKYYYTWNAVVVLWTSYGIPQTKHSTLQLILENHQTQLTENPSFIYQTIQIIFSVRPHVNLDVHPCSLDRICQHPCATKPTEWWVHHCGHKHCTPSSHWQLWCRAGHALMMASNVSAEQSVTRARQVLPIPARHQQKLTLSRANCCNYIFTSWSTYHLFPQLCHAPTTTTIKKSCKEQIKMKFDIALWQNRDQSVTLCWSLWSSARHWRVREWRLTWNKGADSNREPT